METRASSYKGFCSECGSKWFGPPDVGGCEAVLLARRVVELEGAILGFFDAQRLYEHLRTDEEWEAANDADTAAWVRLHEVMADGVAD
jgi:hypothetical protein